MSTVDVALLGIAGMLAWHALAGRRHRVALTAIALAMTWWFLPHVLSGFAVASQLLTRLTH